MSRNNLLSTRPEPSPSPNVQSSQSSVIEKIRLYTEAEVTKFTGIPVTTLRADRFKGQGLPYMKKGKSVRYRLSDIKAYIEQNTVYPQEAA